jgi:hypothetical protein
MVTNEQTVNSKPFPKSNWRTVGVKVREEDLGTFNKRLSLYGYETRTIGQRLYCCKVSYTHREKKAFSLVFSWSLIIMDRFRDSHKVVQSLDPQLHHVLVGCLLPGCLRHP